MRAIAASKFRVSLQQNFRDLKVLVTFQKPTKNLAKKNFQKKEIGKCKKEYAQVFLDERQMNSSFFHMSYAM